MKKLVCMALSAALLAGSVPAYAADYITKVPHTFTARVGTTEFTKDGTAQPLDVAIYTKNGYTMLPLRTFMKAALGEKSQMAWDNETKAATVAFGGNLIRFSIKENTIAKNGKDLPVWGKMEVKDGRVFVPLRNWSGILQSIGYLIEEGDITWDSTTKLATVRAVEQKLDPSNGLEKPALSGKGAQASYAVALSTQYDEIEPLGDGYFLAQKYTGETNVGLGVSMGGRENVRYLLDSKGKVLQTYDTGTDNYMEDGGERTFLVGRNTENGFGNGAIDWEGNTVIPFVYLYVDFFSEGLAAVRDEKNDMGYVNRKGEPVIPTQFEEAEPFSDGLAVVKKTDGTYAYIDKTGKIAIDASQYSSVLPFYEGLAMVRSRNTHKAGFIDKTGKEVIPCQYRWAGYFRNGVTYASDAEGKNWLIDKTGKKLKLIAEGNYLVYVDDDMSNPNQQKNGVAIVEDIVDLPNGEHDHVRRYFDETGELSYETYLLKAGLSEGLAPYRDEKTKKYGYVNESGAWVIAPAFDVAEKFEDGYAVVQNEITLADGTKDVEWGIIQNPNR